MAFNKLIAYVGHAFMLLLIFFSVYFYQERMLHTDNAYGTLTIINTENFIIPHYRYPLVLTQFLPIVAIKFGASIKAVIIAYSINFYLLYYACFLLAVYAYKNIKVALLILLGLLVTTSEIFFLQTEIAHGLIFSSLFYAWLSYSVTAASTFKNLIHQISGVIIFLIAVLFHPLSALFMGLILVWNMLEKRNWVDVKSITFLVLVFLVLLLKAKLTPQDSYEDSFYPTKELLWQSLTNLNQTFVFKFFVARLAGLYLLPTTILLITLIWYGIKKQWLKLLFLLFASVGYVVLASAMFNGDSEIMTERVFLLYGAIVSLGFVHVLFDASSTFNQPKINVALTVLVVGCLVAGVVKILEASVNYRYRLSIVQRQADAARIHKGSKFYMLSEDVAYPFAMWANACEQILYSTLHEPHKTKTIYIYNNADEAKQSLEKIKPNQFMIAPFCKPIGDSLLNPKYFKLNHEHYKYLKLN